MSEVQPWDERVFGRFLKDVIAALEDEPVDIEWVRELLAEMACRVLRFDPEPQEASLVFLAGLEVALNRIEDLQ